VRLFQWDRDFGVFFCTQGISNVGDAAWNVLVPLYVLQLTHNPLQVSAVAVAEVGAYVALRFPLGALSDRREGRRLMIAADVGRLLLTLAIPVVSLLHGPTLTTIYIVIVPLAACSALFESASATAVPMLVPEDERGKAYAWQESLESLAWVVGPPVGGLLAAVAGTGRALALDSASFVVSIVGLVVIRKRFDPVPDSRDEPLRTSMLAGLRLMISDRVLRRDQLIWSLYSVIGSGIVLGLIYVGTRGGRSGDVLATTAIAAYAAGSAAGTLLAGRISRSASSPWLAAAAGLVATAAGAGLVALGAVPAVLAGAALFGLGEGYVLVVHLTLRASATPEGYFGRITGFAGVVGQLTTGLSMVWLGLALRLAQGRTTFAIMGAAAALLAVWVALAPKPLRATVGPVVLGAGTSPATGAASLKDENNAGQDPDHARGQPAET
jgi:predicted MFS family arabinose efflux permease